MKLFTKLLLVVGMILIFVPKQSAAIEYNITSCTFKVLNCSSDLTTKIEDKLADELGVIDSYMMKQMNSVVILFDGEKTCKEDIKDHLVDIGAEIKEFEVAVQIDEENNDEV